jgi:hypothetical protein
MPTLYFAVEDAFAVLTESAEAWSWEFALSGRRPQCAAVDPRRPELAHCGTFDNSLWRSEDGGDSWSRVEVGITHAGVLSVAVSDVEGADNFGVVYAGTEPSAVFRPDDNGETWCRCHGLTDLPSANAWSFRPRPSTHHVTWIAPDPHRSGRLFVALEAGALVHSPDSRRSRGGRAARRSSIGVHRASPGRVYSAACDGYFESRDAGKTWPRLESGLRDAYAWSVAVDRGNPDNFILSSAASLRRWDIQPAKSFIYRRQLTASWQELRGGLPSPTGRRTAVLAGHPRQARTSFAVWEDEVYRSSDGGDRWERLETPELGGRPFNELCALTVVDN